MFLSTVRHRPLDDDGGLKLSVYMIIESRVKDQEKYDAYLALVPGMVSSHGGRYLVRGGPVTPMTGSWRPERMIIIEFPSMKNIDEWLSSPEYRAIAPLREAGADVRSVVLEGHSQ